MTHSTRSVQRLFQHAFGREATVVADAPGRVNLIGEHTDYNGGWVLPMPIALATHVAMAPRDDGQWRVISANAGERDTPLTFDIASLSPQGDWADYVRGMASVIHRISPAVAGADVAITSEVPVGGGVSSSAALEVAIGRAARTLWQLTTSDVELAHLGQRCENEFVGARVGIMDQMAASVGRLGHALYLDTHAMNYEHVPLPSRLDIAVIHSGVHHANASSAYNTRREECERAAQHLGVANLCALPQGDWGRINALPAPLAQRARHVVSENARVAQFVAALRHDDGRQLAQLLRASHASLRDDYQVTVPEVDGLWEIACADAGVVGCRMTGGGFGGCLIVVAHAGEAAVAARRVLDKARPLAPRAWLVLPV